MVRENFLPGQQKAVLESQGKERYQIKFHKIRSVSGAGSSQEPWCEYRVSTSEYIYIYKTCVPLFTSFHNETVITANAVPRYVSSQRG